MKQAKTSRGSPDTWIAFLLQHLSPLPGLRSSIPQYSIPHFDVIMSSQRSSKLCASCPTSTQWKQVLPLPVWARASRCNTFTHPSSAGQSLFAFSLPQHAFPLTLHYFLTAQNRLCPYFADAHFPAAIMAPIHPTTPRLRGILVLLSYKVSIPSFVLPQRREASLAPCTPDALLSALEFALFLSHLSNISFGCFHSQMNNWKTVEWIFVIYIIRLFHSQLKNSRMNIWQM